jgi:hypothetical protein
MRFVRSGLRYRRMRDVAASRAPRRRREAPRRVRVRASQDMAKHFEVTQKMDAINGTLGTLDTTSLEQRQLLLSVLVHAADISHVVAIRAAPVAAGARVRGVRLSDGRGALSAGGPVRVCVCVLLGRCSTSACPSRPRRWCVPNRATHSLTSRRGALAPRRCRGTAASQVRTEFAEQADAEKALGIEPLPFMVETEPSKVLQ